MKHLLSFVLEQLRNHKKNLVSCLIALLVMSVSQGMLIFLIGPVVKTMFGFSKDALKEDSQLFDKIASFLSIDIPSSLQHFVWLVPLVLFCIGLVRTLSLFWYSYQVEVLVLRVITNLRVRFFSGFLKLNYLNISKKNHAQWASHIMNDVILFQGLFADFCKVVIRDMTIVFASVCILLWVDPKVFFIVLTVSFFLGGFIRLVSSLLFGYSKKLQRIQAKMAEWLDHFSNFQEFFRFDTTFYMNQKFKDLNVDFSKSAKKIFKVASFFSPSIEFVVILMIGVSYVFYFNSEYFLQILASLAFMVKPVRNISEQYSRWSRVQGALYEVNKLMVPESNQVKNASVKIEVTDKYLNILDMSMKDHNRVFRFENIQLPRCRFIKIMGDSGVGKTTFLEMLAGLYSDHGQKNFFALMSQYSFLFNGSLKENILYGNKIDSISDSGWISWFKEFDLSKHSINDMIDASRFGLSGGESQRIALMRTIISGKKFLMLDEPFAALDLKNSEKLTKILNSQIIENNITVIMVSHDKKQLTKSDCVLWIDSRQKTHFIDMRHNKIIPEFKAWLES